MFFTGASMRLRLISIFFVCTTLFVFTAESTNTDIKLPFKVGEKAVYDVIVEVKGALELKGKLGVNEVEVVELTNMRGRPVFHCKAVVYSLPIIKSIYELRDEFHVWSDVETFKPYKIEKFIKEGDWTNHILIDLYVDEGYGIYNDKRTKNKRYKLPSGNTHDILSMFFYLRGVEKNKAIELYWTENVKTDKVWFRFLRAKNYKARAFSKWKKVRILEARGKEMYDARIGMAIDYGYVPVYAYIPAFEVHGYRIVLQGKLREYYPDKASRKNEKEKSSWQFW